LRWVVDWSADGVALGLIGDMVATSTVSGDEPVPSML
jgi:hypothetical protein